MHVLEADSVVGLLLFDEPSAALDPVAEHGWFLPRLPTSSANDLLRRTFLATSRNSREEDNGLLDSPLRKLDEVCGHHSVRTFEVPDRGISIDDPAL